MNYLRIKKPVLPVHSGSVGLGVVQYLEHNDSVTLVTKNNIIYGGEAVPDMQLPCGGKLEHTVHWDGYTMSVTGILGTVKDGAIIAPWFLTASRSGNSCIPHWNIKECRACPIGGCCDCIARGGNDCIGQLSASISNLKEAINAVPIPVTFGDLEEREQFRFPEGTHFHKKDDIYVKVSSNGSYLVGKEGMPGYVWGCDQIVERINS